MSSPPETGPTSPTGRVVPEAHHEHRDVSGGPLRPAVFGAMDGLVSNLALICGVAGSNARPGAIALAGLAGLVAGAFSMAVGEYTSVASQTELTRAEIDNERVELHRNPIEEQAELAGMYVKRGVHPDLARQVAAQLSQDPEQRLRVHVREELGVDPDDLPSPWTASIASFLSFTVGAFVPLLPYLLGAGTLWVSIVLSLVGLFTVGAFTSRYTNRGWLYSGLRQLVLGSVAAGITYLIGNAVGTGLA